MGFAYTANTHACIPCTAHSQACLPRTKQPTSLARLPHIALLTLRHACLALPRPLLGMHVLYYPAHSQARLPPTTLLTLRHVRLPIHCPFSGTLASHYTANCLPRTTWPTLRQALSTPTAKLLGHDRVLYRTRSLL